MSAEFDHEGDNLDVRSLALGLARSTRWIIASVVLGTLAGLGYGVVRPNEYVSEGKIEVRLGIRERRSPESSLELTSTTPAPLPGIADEIELLSNPEIYRRIAQEIGPERLLAPYDPTATDGSDASLLVRWVHRLQASWFQGHAASPTPEQSLSDAADYVEGAIELKPVSDTSYLRVRATASTAEMARLLAHTFLTSARQRHHEVYSTKTELSFVSEQLRRYEEESQAAEQAYREHRDACGFYDLDSQKKSYVATLADHEDRIRASTIHSFELEDQLAFVEKELAATPPKIEKIVPPSVKINPEYQAALEQLQKLTSERSGLASVYTEGSEIFQRKADQLDTEIRKVEKHLKETLEFVEYGAAVREESANPRYEELTIRRDELRQEKETTTKTIELWQRSKEEQDKRLHAALLCEATHRDLAQVAERAKARVQELLAALERDEALALLDRQSDMDSLRIAADGELPREKAGPDRQRFLLLGFFGGLALGMFLAALRFLLDTRFHDPEAVQKDLELAVIGVVPEARAWRTASARVRGRAPTEAGP